MGSFREEFIQTETVPDRHHAAIKERFIDAAINRLARLHSNQWKLDKVPEHLREQFLKFMEKMTKKGGVLTKTCAVNWIKFWHKSVHYIFRTYTVGKSK
jgi:hypothetical protein